jgi:hypothetical protein
MDADAPADDAVIADPPPVMDVILEWIGFDQDAPRDRIREEGFETFDDLVNMKEKDICDLAESNSRMSHIRHTSYPLHDRTNPLAQDFIRIDEHPTIEGIDGAEAFKVALDMAYQRADVQKIENDQSDTVSKAADPGKFKDDRKWSEWEPAFTNYLSTKKSQELMTFPCPMSLGSVNSLIARWTTQASEKRRLPVHH